MESLALKFHDKIKDYNAHRFFKEYIINNTGKHITWSRNEKESTWVRGPEQKPTQGKVRLPL